MGLTVGKGRLNPRHRYRSAGPAERGPFGRRRLGHVPAPVVVSPISVVPLVPGNAV